MIRDKIGCTHAYCFGMRMHISEQCMCWRVEFILSPPGGGSLPLRCGREPDKGEGRVIIRVVMGRSSENKNPDLYL